VNLLFLFLLTFVPAWIGWRWKRWRGVVIVMALAWVIFFVVGTIGLMMMGPKLQEILQNYPAPS
jgi:hypothetical protein